MNRLQKFAFRMASKIAGRHPQDPTIAKWWASLGYGGEINVDPDTAMKLSAVWGAVTLISQAMAILPFHVFKRVAGGKEKDPNHPLWPILMEQPNPRQSSKEFQEQAQSCLLLRGNAYGEIISTGGKAVSEVWLLHPDHVRVFEHPENRERVYEYTDPKTGQVRILLQDEVWHIMGHPAEDGLTGLSPIEYHRRTIGKSIAAEIYEEKFFENDATPGIILTHPGKLNPEGQQNLREAWDRSHQGAGKAFRTGVLQEGVTAKEMGITHRDAQYIELLKFGIADIARIYHVPLHMLAELDRATFNNIEELGQGFVTYTLMYWMKSWESSAGRDLFTPTSRRTHFAKFNADAFLRGDIATRYEAYSKATGSLPWQTRNEIRELEDMLPIEGGDKLFVPVNMQEVGAESAEIAET